MIPHGVLEIAKAMQGCFAQDRGVRRPGRTPGGGEGLARLVFEHLVVRPQWLPAMAEVGQETTVLTIDSSRVPRMQQRIQLRLKLTRQALLYGIRAHPAPDPRKFHAGGKSAGISISLW